MTDLLYVVREGDHNPELRHSLRSVCANLPHERVWIGGYKPSWVSDEVGYIPVPQGPVTFRDSWQTKFTNTRINLAASLRHPDMSEDVVLFNDDFYVTEPINEVPVLTYGNLDYFLTYFRATMKVPSRYVLAEEETMQWCEEQGFAQLLSYALHVPMPINRTMMRETLERLPLLGKNEMQLHVRTAYGNMHAIGGERIADVKVEPGTPGRRHRLNGVYIDGNQTTNRTLPKPFASSNDRTFASYAIGRWIRAMFPDPCRYER